MTSFIAMVAYSWAKADTQVEAVRMVKKDNGFEDDNFSLIVVKVTGPTADECWVDGMGGINYGCDDVTERVFERRKQ